MREAADKFRAAILAALGHAPELIEPGKLHRFGTSNRRGDLAGWCKLFDDQRGGTFGDFRSGITDTWCATERGAMTPAQRAAFARQVAQAAVERQAEQHRTWARNAEGIAALWRECVPLVPGDPVTLYLKRRGFAGVWPLPECLRYHRALPYWHDGERIGAFPAMVAPMMTNDGRMVALHRTYLTTDGSKAPVPTVKKLTGAAGSLAGACIPLFKPMQGKIGIAEGIETALAGWRLASMPTVAAYSAGNLAAWQWPPGVHRLAIFADNDAAGADAADKLRQRARAAGIHATAIKPSEPGLDWADVWAAHVAERGAA